MFVSVFINKRLLYPGLPRDFHTGPAVFSKTKRRYDTRL